MLRQPALIDGLRGGVGVRAVEQHDLAGELGLLEEAEQVLLGAPGLGEDDRLLLKRGGSLAQLGLGGGGEAATQGGEQDFALRVLDDRLRQGVELTQLSHLLPQLGQLLGRERRTCRRGGVVVVLVPFVGQLVELLPVLGHLFRRGIHSHSGGRCRFEALNEALQRRRNGIGGRGQQLAQDQRHQLALAGRQRIERRPLQVVGHQVVEPLLLLGGHELLHQGVPIRVLDVLQHLPAQRALAEGREAFLQLGEVGVVAQAREARAIALQVAEGEVVDDADQPVQLQQRVLQWRRGEQHLREWGDGLLDGERDLARSLVDIAQAMRFVDDDEIPRGLAQIGLFAARELVGAQDHGWLLKGLRLPARIASLKLRASRITDGR